MHELEVVRLCVFRSSQHIYAQVIDDTNASSLAVASTLTKTLAEALEGKSKQEAAKVVGAAIAGVEVGVQVAGGDVEHAMSLAIVVEGVGGFGLDPFAAGPQRWKQDDGELESLGTVDSHDLDGVGV